MHWAQWRTVVNAIIQIIHSILTYAAPVWYTGQTTLRANCTQPRMQPPGGTSLERNAPDHFCRPSHHTTHQLMGIMPIDLRLDMLIKNPSESLRLYRLLLNSQLAAL